MLAKAVKNAVISFMKTEVIYARVPIALKEGCDAYASQRGSTLTGAVVDLLERGLSAVSDERSIAELEKNLAEVTAAKNVVEAALHAAETELVAVKAFVQRAGLEVGTCPNCRKSITGYDLLGAGACPRCSQALSSLIAPAAASPTLDQRELMFLVGALGAVLGIAYLASK